MNEPESDLPRPSQWALSASILSDSDFRGLLSPFPGDVVMWGPTEEDIKNAPLVKELEGDLEKGDRTEIHMRKLYGEES